MGDFKENEKPYKFSGFLVVYMIKMVQVFLLSLVLISGVCKK